MIIAIEGLSVPVLIVYMPWNMYQGRLEHPVGFISCIIGEHATWVLGNNACIR